MPPRKNARKNTLAGADAVGGRDLISNLPDGVLQHMLSFLPAQDAVRTCVLAKRWRHMWESTTVLRFVCGGMNEPKSIQDFVDQLLRLRMSGSTPLDTCEFRLGEIDEFNIDEDGIDVDGTSRINLWTRIALQCKVRVLQFSCVGDNYPHIRP
jgi:hypothetical protein